MKPAMLGVCTDNRLRRIGRQPIVREARRELEALLHRFKGTVAYFGCPASIGRIGRSYPPLHGRKLSLPVAGEGRGGVVRSVTVLMKTST